MLPIPIPLEHKRSQLTFSALTPDDRVTVSVLRDGRGEGEKGEEGKLDEPVNYRQGVLPKFTE